VGRPTSPGLPVTTPAWGISPERYESATGAAACVMGEADWPSPVVPFVGPDRRVLDLGCGTGHTARLLCEKGCTVVGVELDERAAVSAGAWCERVVVCDLDVTSLADVLRGEQFDVVVAGDILEHLRDPEALLRSLVPILAPDGTVVASIPNVAHGSVRLALVSGCFDYADLGILDRTHLRFFTRHGIEQLFASAGFVIEKLDRLLVDVSLGEPYERELLPDGLEEAVAAMPEATTYEFVLVARPSTPSAAGSAGPAEPTEAAAATGPPAPPGHAPPADGAPPVAPGPAAQQVVVAPLEAEVLREKDRAIAGLRSQVAEVMELRVRAAAQLDELAARRAELDAITASRAWKAWMKVRPAAHAVLGVAERPLSRLASSSRRRSSRSG
jgi:2-polyprenyl-3-methyl-5-hydroxy-6-metoxy-1,4-benzoquinol methylase